MPVTTQHPEYIAAADDWQLMSDALKGERAVKAAGTTYLPKTSGMLEAEALADGGPGELTASQAGELYKAYKGRAEYPLWVKDALRTMMGMVSRLEPEISLPSRMDSLLSESTSDGFGPKQLFQRICSDLLVKGRKVLLCDFDGAGQPYIATYTAEDAINWNESSAGGRQDLTLAVLRESRSAAVDEFDHTTETVYRVLDLVFGACRVRVLGENGQPVEDEAILGAAGPDSNEPLTFLPLVFAGSTDNSPGVDEIPLLTMAQAALKYYQLSADYYQSMHYTAHPQPVVKGLDEGDLRVTGPMAAWVLPTEGDAYYMEFTGAGVEKTREAMQDQRNAALEAGARVIDTQQQESGDARRARQDDQHATLHSVVVQAAAAVEQCFRYLALWMREDPEACVFSVVPKFSSEEVDSAMMQIIGNLVLAGELPRQVLFGAMRKSGLTDLSDDELSALRDVGEMPEEAADG